MGRGELQRIEDELHVKDAIPVGLWADATPYSWDRKQSLELICCSFPGLGERLQNTRIPLVAWPKSWTHAETKRDILRVLAWSLTWASAGVSPAQRHDGSAWTDAERPRRGDHGPGCAWTCDGCRGHAMGMAENMTLHESCLLPMRITGLCGPVESMRASCILPHCANHWPLSMGVAMSCT